MFRLDCCHAEANAMTEAQIESTPAFRRNPDKMFTSSISYSDQCELLAYGIPAISGPAGTRVLHFSDVPGIDEARNVDMIYLKSFGQWGRTGGFFGSRWLHSDLKFMSFPHVFLLFEQFNTKGLLR